MEVSWGYMPTPTIRGFPMFSSIIFFMLSRVVTNTNSNAHPSFECAFAFAFECECKTFAFAFAFECHFKTFDGSNVLSNAFQMLGYMNIITSPNSH